jgi:hypothetical protein
MPTVISDAAGPFGRNLPLSREVKRAVNEAGFATPGRRRGRRRHVRACRRDSATRRRGHRRGRAPVARRPRLVPEGAHGEGAKKSAAAPTRTTARRSTRRTSRSPASSGIAPRSTSPASHSAATAAADSSRRNGNKQEGEGSQVCQGGMMRGSVARHLSNVALRYAA